MENMRRTIEMEGVQKAWIGRRTVVSSKSRVTFWMQAWIMSPLLRIISYSKGDCVRHCIHRPPSKKESGRVDRCGNEKTSCGGNDSFLDGPHLAPGEVKTVGQVYTFLGWQSVADRSQVSGVGVEWG